MTENAVDRWCSTWTPIVRLDGPYRIYDANPAPENEVKRVIGFTKPIDIDPLVWEGDGA